VRDIQGGEVDDGDSCCCCIFQLKILIKIMEFAPLNINYDIKKANSRKIIIPCGNCNILVVDL
jgi:hypothetical protein